MKRKYIKTIVLTLIVSNMLSFVSYAVEPEVTIANNDVKVEDTNTQTLTDNKEETKEEVLEVVNINTDFLKKFDKLSNLTYEDMVKIEFAENVSGTSDNPVTTDINKELDRIIIILNKAIKNNDKELLKQTIKETFYIHQIMDLNNSTSHSEKDQLDYLILNSISLIFKLGENNENLQNELLTYIADEMYVSSANKFNANGAGNTSFLNRYGSYLVKVSKLYVQNEKVKQIILYSYSKINSMTFLDNSESITTPGQAQTVYDPEKVPSKVDYDKIPIIPPPEDDTDYGDNVDILEPIKPPVTKPENGEYVPKPDVDLDYDVSFSETVIENGICYKVTTYKDANGNVIKTTKEKNEEDCVILDYDDINEENKVFIDEHNENNAVSLDLEVWNSLQTNDLNKLNDNTIQFTINKDSENPYYFDTRINTSSNNTVTFTQLIDTFEQIKAKETVYLLQDKDKLLFVAEGKTRLVIDKKTEYTSDEISSLLNNFSKLGLKLDEKKSLEESPIDKNEVKLLNFANKDYTLENSPTTKDSVLQLPIEEVSTILGYSVKNLDDKIVLNYNKDDKDIVIEILKNSNKVSINGTNKITSTETQNIDNVCYGEMSIAARELGYTLNFDSELGKINIK